MKRWCLYFSLHLPVMLISDYLSRIKELHRGKDRSTQPSVDGLFCTQSKQHQLCYALFSLSIDHKMTCQICNREKVSSAEKILFIRCQLNGPAASEPHREHVLACSRHTSFMNAFAFLSTFPFKNRERSYMWCGLIGVQNRCQSTVWMKNLYYCALAR